MTLLEILNENTFREEVKVELAKRINNNKLTLAELKHLLKIQKIRENHPNIIPKDKVLIAIDEIDEELEFYHRQRRYRAPLRKSRDAFEKLINTPYDF